MCKPDCLRTLQSRSKLSISCLLIAMLLQNLEIAVLLEAFGPIFLITSLSALLQCSSARSRGVFPAIPCFAFTDLFQISLCASLGDRVV